MFDNFGDSERWSYARTKTEGLSNPQKALQSLAPVPIVYFLVRDQGAIYRLAAALITWVVTYLLFPLIARGYYWWRAPLHLAEARIEELQKTVAELNGDLFNLTAQITRKQSNQDTANWLTQRHAYGVHELLNKRPASADADEWLYRIDQFTESVVEGLHERDASPQVIHHIEVLGTFPPVRTTASGKVNRGLGMLLERLRRIKTVSEKYADAQL